VGEINDGGRKGRGLLEEESINKHRTEEKKVIFASSLGTVFECMTSISTRPWRHSSAALFSFHLETTPRRCFRPL